MAKLRQIFETTTGADADALLSTPGLTYVVELLRDAGETLKVDDLEQLYAEENWKTDRSFTWLELQALQHKIQTTAVNADLVDTTANAVAPISICIQVPQKIQCERTSTEKLRCRAWSPLRRRKVLRNCSRHAL